MGGHVRTEDFTSNLKQRLPADPVDRSPDDKVTEATAATDYVELVTEGWAGVM